MILVARALSELASNGCFWVAISYNTQPRAQTSDLKPYLHKRMLCVCLRDRSGVHELTRFVARVKMYVRRVAKHFWTHVVRGTDARFGQAKSSVELLDKRLSFAHGLDMSIEIRSINRDDVVLDFTLQMPRSPSTKRPFPSKKIFAVLMSLCMTCWQLDFFGFSAPRNNFASSRHCFAFKTVPFSCACSEAREAFEQTNA